MFSNLALTSAQVKKAVEAVKKNRPLYTEMLDVYGRIFVAQEESRSRLRIEPIQISPEMLSIKAVEKFPLIEIRQFRFDEEETARLFLTICKALTGNDAKLAAASATLLNAVNKTVAPVTLCAALLGGDEALFENMAIELEIDKQILGFITLSSLAPSLSACADHLSAYLNRDDPWLKGYCPICGSAPILSILSDEGARSLVCGFCRHQWPVKRACCPFCSNLDSRKLRYFYSEEEEGLRVDLCDNCKKYVKTVDARKAGRLLYPPLEQVSTLHLDIKAEEMGFESGTRLFIEL
ncbi:MAG: formate dehydrogenase accessory protein FdhE [Desulfobacteraceae bacterium]|nr:MAG: formate dehydrogenase accessory protein FdhE [Desulfobacteraceae bacterium]